MARNGDRVAGSWARRCREGPGALGAGPLWIWPAGWTTGGATSKDPDRTSRSSGGPHPRPLSAGLVAEAPGEAHRPDVDAERPGHAVDPAQQHRGGVVQSSTVAKELLGGGEAQVVALVVGGDGGIARTEQLGEGQQIELMALEARLDQHRPRIPAGSALSADRQGDSAGIATSSSGKCSSATWLSA
jgi:hypothetical protein